MQPRIDLYRLSPEGYKALLGLENYLSKSTVEKKLLHLIKLRVSQINGCAFCLDMHWKDLKVEGETEQRMYSLDAWRETSYYTDRERAALAWAEAVTNITDGHAPDEVFEEARQYFSEQEMADLTLAVTAINSWNRAQHRIQRGAGNVSAATAEKASVSILQEVHRWGSKLGVYNFISQICETRSSRPQLRCFSCFTRRKPASW